MPGSASSSTGMANREEDKSGEEDKRICLATDR